MSRTSEQIRRERHCRDLLTARGLCIYCGVKPRKAGTRPHSSGASYHLCEECLVVKNIWRGRAVVDEPRGRRERSDGK